MSSETYSTFDIKKKLGIPIDRLKDWMTRGFVEPSVQKASGQGTKNIFSINDLYLIGLFEYLIKRGFSRKDAAARIRSIRFLEEIARGSDRIERGRLLDPGLSKIKALWGEIFSADFIGFLFFKDYNLLAQTSNLPPSVFPLNFKDNGKVLAINSDQIHNSDDILIVNFKKIRDQVDNAVK